MRVERVERAGVAETLHRVGDLLLRFRPLLARDQDVLLALGFLDLVVEEAQRVLELLDGLLLRNPLLLELGRDVLVLLLARERLTGEVVVACAHADHRLALPFLRLIGLCRVLLLQLLLVRDRDRYGLLRFHELLLHLEEHLPQHFLGIFGLRDEVVDVGLDQRPESGKDPHGFLRAYEINGAPATMTVTDLPRHVGIIMDGNGRWAQLRNQPRLDGHRAGAESVRDVTRKAREIGIEALTLYAFSSQNWARPVDEVAGLMELLRDFLCDERAEIMDNGIRLEALGDIERLPPIVREPLEELRAASRQNSRMVLTLALSYGGRESITRAARAAARDISAGVLRAEDLDADRLGAYLPTAGLPPLDLLIRTSGEQRVSNFMLWELAYAELIFVDVLWPEFRREHLQQCLDLYAARERRFGLTSRAARGCVGRLV